MKKTFLVVPLLILTLLCMGFTWNQATPTDKKVCAGWRPSDYDEADEGHATIIPWPSDPGPRDRGFYEDDDDQGEDFNDYDPYEDQQ